MAISAESALDIPPPHFIRFQQVLVDYPSEEGEEAVGQAAGLVEERLSKEAQQFVVELGRNTSMFDRCKLRLVLSISQKQHIVDELLHAMGNCAEIALVINGFGPSGSKYSL